MNNTINVVRRESDALFLVLYSVTISLPEWINDPKYHSRDYDTIEERMSLAIELSARNVAEGTGGPFGCAIFEVNVKTGKSILVSTGVNQVVPLTNSTLHGEMVAIQFAQQKLKSFSLQQTGREHATYELYTSCEPCCMCLGGTLWSGVSKLVCAATKADAGAIGFDEGPVFDESYEHLEKAGIQVLRGVLQKEGAEVLKKYGETGLIYNR
jgi:tRNA(Arg) A34 adenosine deaminase TadA